MPASWTCAATPIPAASGRPAFRIADGRFWLVYTDVKRFDGDFKDAHNYIVTAPAIEGPWSDPVYVNSSGFDPSLFHEVDDEGRSRKWFLNMVWNHRPETVGGNTRVPAFDGILLQEWDAKTQRLVGPVSNIYRGTDRGLVEGPHLFKRQGWYYLVTAEGGTGYDHAITMARSRHIAGPYETHPDQHLLSSQAAPDAPLQRAGHGQVVELADGSVYASHLCTRPLPGPGRGFQRSPLGRETALQRCEWRDDGWLYLAPGGGPRVHDARGRGAFSPDPARCMPLPNASPSLRDFAGARAAAARNSSGCARREPERLFTLYRPGAAPVRP